MKSIGGYLGIELTNGIEYHNNCLALNTGRNCLEYILRANKFKKIYIPKFTCDVLMEAIKKTNIKFEYYSLNKNLEPLFNFENILKNEGFLYTNYFGIKDEYVLTLSNKNINLIIDNSQAFYSKPVIKKNIHTFYSARKFFGVADGAYLYTLNTINNKTFEQDISYNRYTHLLKRVDISVEDGYKGFLLSEQKLINQPIKIMSKLTKAILSAIDYNQKKEQRMNNFFFLHKHLKSSNFLNFEKLEIVTPLNYPYWSDNLKLRDFLIQNKIYIPLYWPNVIKNCSKTSLEHKLANEIVHIPIDQNYSSTHMYRIIELIKTFSNNE